MGEEKFLGYEAGHGHDLPAGGAVEHVVEPAEVGNGVGAHAQLLETGEIFVASAADEQPRLALEQRAPRRMVLRGIGLPVLRDYAIAVAGSCRGHGFQRQNHMLANAE